MDGVYEFVCEEQNNAPYLAQLKPRAGFDTAIEAVAAGGEKGAPRMTLTLSGNGGVFSVAEKQFNLLFGPQGTGPKPECLIFDQHRFTSIGAIKQVANVTPRRSASSQPRTPISSGMPRKTRNSSGVGRTPTTLTLTSSTAGRRRRAKKAPMIATAPKPSSSSSSSSSSSVTPPPSSTTTAPAPPRVSPNGLRKATTASPTKIAAKLASRTSPKPSSSSSMTSSSMTSSSSSLGGQLTAAEYRAKREAFAVQLKEYRALEKKIEAEINVFSEVGRSYREAKDEAMRSSTAEVLQKMYAKKHKEFDAMMVRYDAMNTRLKAMQRALKAHEQQQQQQQPEVAATEG
ncbi:hypothetical protein PTSG_09480 [Salpingoeca rosetta]|uniref:Uncharacterized protein n=1 Tax=Salpingoeca rosetta (strain ATCC 50818 / BSB-021) TaxID=946362 RepID=F2UL48_SALR5|nr:uncharacterized protein PTSG_09480 [Salpingoeca rosetta]EGD77847.1 hypothetical protein PTSG_09480 [Salpingoeca rosetta]|eukprot:XP_004989911.1 hypothetical protein PTSG_09480 [Salpingoeca rosetta]